MPLFISPPLGLPQRGQFHAAYILTQVISPS